ncbi:MAG: 2-isopropylmalate synthase, partial [Oscillospiraceae bacterium]|nr:2-isopropylmalate synthase [Oscillospiraceae bacterium]
MSTQKLIILDTTLRDGEQTPGVNLNLTEKLEIARQLERLGVDVIEAGFPATSPGDFEAVRAVSQSVECATAALCRCVESDIRKGWTAVKYSPKPRLHLFIATSEIHMKHKLRMQPDEVMRRAVQSVKLAVSLCGDVEFSCEDASRSDPAFIYEILSAAIDHGARTVNIADTVGYAMPDEFGALVRGCIENVRGIKEGKAIMSTHCHNDLGLAVANTLASIQNGARQIECTVNGIGERAGNCSLEEVIMGLDVRSSLHGISHSIDTTRIHRTSRRVAALTGIQISPCKAIVGANAFVHESGIHQDGMLKNPMTYEIMTP